MALWLGIIAIVGELLCAAQAQLVVVDRDTERAMFMTHAWTDPSLVPDLAVTCLNNGIDAVNCDKIYRELRTQHIGGIGDGEMAPNPPTLEVRVEVETGVETGSSESSSSGSEGIVHMCTLPEPGSPDSTVVSIIIPSLNKPTLERALASLDVQRGIDDGDFEVIIVLDGVSIGVGTGGSVGGAQGASGVEGMDEAQAERLFRNRPWLCAVPLATRVGNGNSGGEVRNIGMNYARGTLIGFLDDDDCLAADYVALCRSELTLMNEVYDVHDVGRMHGGAAHAVDAADTASAGARAGAVVFRMLSNMPYAPLLPPPHARALKAEHVGISFAVRRSLLLQNPTTLRFRSSPREDFDFLSAVAAVSAIVLSPHVTYFVRSAPRALPETMVMAVAALPRVRIARGGAGVERVLTGLNGLEGGGQGVAGGDGDNSRYGDTPLSLHASPTTTRVALTMPVYVVTVNASGSATDEKAVQKLQVREGDSVEVAVGAFCQVHALVEDACQALLAAARAAVTAEGAGLLVSLADGRIYLNPTPVLGRGGGNGGGSSGVSPVPPGTVTADQIRNNDVPVLYIGADEVA